MSYCEFKPLSKEDGSSKFRCCKCGYTTPIELKKAPGSHSRICSVENSPSFYARVSSYVTAIERWEAAGRPSRTDEEVTEVVTKGCMKCEFFTGTQCLHCGCSISLPENERTSVIGIAFDPARFNKPRMATEDCPFHCKRCGHSVWKHLDGACECGNCKEFIDPRKAARPP